MPNASYRRAVGIARELGHSALAAAITAGATSIPLVSATGFVATSKITIYDGSNTEVVTASALVGTTLTTGATANAHSAGCVVTTVGTSSAGPTTYAPVTKFDPKDNRTRLNDAGWRAAVAQSFGLIDGVASSDISLSGDFFPDTTPYLLIGMLGAVDFTGGTPNTHLAALKNTGTTAPSYLQLTDLYLPNVGAGVTRQYSARMTDFTLNFTADGMLSWDATASGCPSGLVALPTVSVPSTVPLAAYIGLLKIGGTLTPLIVDGSIDWKRDPDIINNVDGNTAPYDVFVGPLDVTGKIQVIAEDETFLTYFEANTQPSFELLFGNGIVGAGLLSLDCFFNQIGFIDGSPDMGKAHLEYAMDWRAIANLTDGNVAGTGYSPGRVTVKNSLATGTYG